MRVHLGDDKTADLNAVLKGLSLIKCSLPDSGVEHEDDLVGTLKRRNI
jgi:hypothetical protein